MLRVANATPWQQSGGRRHRGRPGSGSDSGCARPSIDPPSNTSAPSTHPVARRWRNESTHPHSGLPLPDYHKRHQHTIVGSIPLEPQPLHHRPQTQRQSNRYNLKGIQRTNKYISSSITGRRSGVQRTRRAHASKDVAIRLAKCGRKYIERRAMTDGMQTRRREESSEGGMSYGFDIIRGATRGEERDGATVVWCV